MNVTINSQRLAAELQLLNRVVLTKPPRVILTHALLRAEATAEGGALSLYATDVEVGLTAECPAFVNEPGEIALPVARLLQMVEQFPDTDVNIAITGGAKVTIQCGNFTSNMLAMPVDDFPMPPKMEGPASRFNGAPLIGLIGQTRHAISPTATKYVMRGALLTSKDGRAAMVATDGKRLALAQMPVGEGEPSELIVPLKALELLSGQAIDDDIEITVGVNHLFFAFGSRLLTSHKIAETFPSYERIIPQENPYVAGAELAVLSAALRRVILAADDDGSVYFDFAPGQLGLSSASNSIGSADEALALNYEGERVKLCLNGAHVLDFLDSAVSKSVTLSFKDANSAVLFLDGNDHFGVIMTMRMR